MKNFIKRHYESVWIKLAARILIGRNVQRSLVVSRRDNNDMWYIAELLQLIAKRISTKYK